MWKLWSNVKQQERVQHWSSLNSQKSRPSQPEPLAAWRPSCKATRFYNRHLVRLNFRETTPNRARFHELPVMFPLSASLPSLTRSRTPTEEERRRVPKLITCWLAIAVQRYTTLTFNRGQWRHQNFCLVEKQTRASPRDNGPTLQEHLCLQRRSSQDRRNDTVMVSAPAARSSDNRAVNGFPARVRPLRPTWDRPNYWHFHGFQACTRSEIKEAWK